MLTPMGLARVKWSTRHSATDRGSTDFFNDRTSRETIIGRNLQNEVELGWFESLSRTTLTVGVEWHVQAVSPEIN